MAIKQFELYLDESGDFNEEKEGHDTSAPVSLVGGLLSDPVYMTTDRINSSFKGKVHACSGYSKSYLNLLKTLHDDGCAFVVFENTEKIRVINSDFTYINIISEGLVRLFQELAIEYPQGVFINVVIAQRQLPLKEYTNRIKEKIIMALGRKQISGVNYNIEISDARKDKRLFFADIICNTWLTIDRINTKGDGTQVQKFTPEERSLIRSIYDPRWKYSVFEDMTITYLKQLLADRHLGEAMLQICALPKQTGFVRLRNTVLKRIEEADPYEQDTYFTQMSLMIGEYTNLHRYTDGIWLAENYLQYFLNAFTLSGHIAAVVPFWRFDTYYYILTMYDHVGNTAKCQEYLKKCQENISCVNRSWEHIDYYFGFCIRELNVLMGRYAFEEVLERSSRLIEILSKAKDLFGMIKTYNDTEQPVRSELLGKIYGVRLEAIINLLRRRPEMLNEALSISAKAITEFDDPRDLSRQYQWRCLLLSEAGKPVEAYDALLKSASVAESDASANTFLDTIFSMRPGSYDFLLWHYTNVMLSMKHESIPKSTSLFKTLVAHPRFLEDLKNKEKSGHPWNLILWNVGRYVRSEAEDDYSTYKSLLQRALSMTQENPSNLTMLAFSVSMKADHLLWCTEHDPDHIVDVRSEFRKVCLGMKDAGMTEGMDSVLHISDVCHGQNLSRETLAAIAESYLK